MKILFVLHFILLSVVAVAQTKHPNILDARRSGIELIKAPVTGILKVDVTEELSNVVFVYLCDYRGSVPIACREDYHVTMTTATGRVKEITDYKDNSFGVIRSDEFPLRIDVKVQGLRGEERYPLTFSVKLLYSGFYYRICLYEEWTGMKGINN